MAEVRLVTRLKNLVRAVGVTPVHFGPLAYYNGTAAGVPVQVFMVPANNVYLLHFVSTWSEVQGAGGPFWAQGECHIGVDIMLFHCHRSAILGSRCEHEATFWPPLEFQYHDTLVLTTSNANMWMSMGCAYEKVTLGGL